MKQAILQIIYPERQPSGYISGDQACALDEISSISRANIGRGKEPRVLGEYSWLLSLDSDLPTLSRLVAVADNAGLSYRVAYLEDVEWNYFNQE